jgi:DNA-binding CsgD family transcriptional regulator
MASRSAHPPAIIGDIYESACEPGHEGLMRALLRVFPGNSAVTLVADPVKGPVGEVYGLPQEVMQSYSNTYWKTDPWAAKAGWTWSGQTLFRGTDYVTPIQLMETQYYDEFAGPIRVVKLLTGLMSLKPAISAAVSIHRNLRDPEFSDQECQDLEALLPHVRRSLQLKQRLNGSLDGHIGLAALDALAFGCIVCDGKGRVVFANRAAEEISAANGGIRLGHFHNGLQALLADETQQLLPLIAGAAAGGPGGTMALTGPGGRRLYVLVTPLPRRFTERPGLALVALRPADAQSTLTELDVIRLFNLSPAEARLAVRLAQGAALAEIAGQSGVSPNTLKTQLAQVFLKTETGNQRDLIRRLSLIPQLR